MDRIAVTFLLVCLLGACDKTEKAAPQPEAAVSETPQTSATATATEDENAQSAQPVMDEDAAAAEEKDNPEKKTAKLNLSLPDNLSADDTAQAQQEARLLPDMFARQESRTKVSGGVQRDSENPDLINSINGAEVSVEFKTD